MRSWSGWRLALVLALGAPRRRATQPALRAPCHKSTLQTPRAAHRIDGSPSQQRHARNASSNGVPGGNTGRRPWRVTMWPRSALGAPWYACSPV